MPSLTLAERRELVGLLRRLLDAVDRGELDADTPAGRRFVAYLTGAATALEAVEGLAQPASPEPSTG